MLGGGGGGGSGSGKNGRRPDEPMLVWPGRIPIALGLFRVPPASGGHRGRGGGGDLRSPYPVDDGPDGIGRWGMGDDVWKGQKEGSVES